MTWLDRLLPVGRFILKPAPNRMRKLWPDQEAIIAAMEPIEGYIAIGLQLGLDFDEYLAWERA